MSIKCIIVDDEPLARKGLKEYIADAGFLELIGEYDNALKTTAILSEGGVQLLFLDIQMPKITGMEFFRTLKNPPPVIFTTAYPQYAIEGFEVNALDYLVKPITFNRFFKAVSKAKDYHHLLARSASNDFAKTNSTENYFFIKCDYKYERIYFDDILYIEAMQNYVTIFTQKGKYITLLYLKNVEQNLDKQSFIRVHKSFIVSIPKIEAIENNEIIIQSFRIPISRNYRDQVIERVVNDKLWKK